MQTKLRAALPEASLSRILVSFEQELLAASDEEIMQAAKDLGMDPAMKGSAAFFGVTRPFGVAHLDMHSLASWATEHRKTKTAAAVVGAAAKADPPEPKRPTRRRFREDPQDK
jgi:hypothetical protein